MFHLLAKPQFKPLPPLEVGCRDDLALVFEDSVERHEPCVGSGGVHDFVVEYISTLRHWWKSRGDDALVAHCDVALLQIVPDPQVPLTSLEYITCWPLSEAHLVDVWDAPLRVGINDTCLIILF